MSNQFEKMAVSKWAKALGHDHFIPAPVLHRPELQPGVRVRVTWPSRGFNYWDIFDRVDDTLRMTSTCFDGRIVRSRATVHADGVYEEDSGARLELDVLPDHSDYCGCDPCVCFADDAPSTVENGGHFVRLEDDSNVPTQRTLRARYCAESCGKLNAEPLQHDPGCPVAPVPGLHGGMRERVAGDGWERDDVACKWRKGSRRWQVRDWMFSDIKSAAIDPGTLDALLGHFYLPPDQPSTTPACLPVDSDPEMETVAARATHEPERWKAVRR